MLIVVTLIVYSTDFIRAANKHQSNPLLTSLTAIADTFIASDKSSQRRPNLDIFWVGHNQSLDIGRQKALLKFALPSSVLPTNSTIVSAELRVEVAGTTTNDRDINVNVSRLTGEWQENINWNEYSDPANGLNTSLPTAPIAINTSLNKPYNWDVKEILVEWMADPDRGAELSLVVESSETSGDHERSFWSKDCNVADCGPEPAGRRPQLIINYESPTPTPMPTPTLSSTPTATPTPIPLDLSLSAVAATQAGTTTFSGDFFTIDIIATNLNVITATNAITFTNAFITSTFPSGFQLVGDMNGGVTKTVANTTYLTWDLGVLTPEEAIPRTYKIKRIETGTVSFKPNRPPITGTINTTLDLDLDLAAPLDEYCYEWDFGEGPESIYTIRGQPRLTYTYVNTGTYDVNVRVLGSNGYSAIISPTKVITITDNMVGIDTNTDIMSNCTLPDEQLTLQGVPIGVEASWDTDSGSGNTPVIIQIIKPKTTLFYPILYQ